MNDAERGRSRMVELLQRQGISDSGVLDALRRVPRELFVPTVFRPHAHADRALPIEAGQTISQPFIVAYMTERLELSADHKVLEVGTGSGYQAAVLAMLCRRVYTMERSRVLLALARRRFEDLGLVDVISRLGDGWRGWSEQAPFDRIIVTAAAPELPPDLVGQLAENGRMVVPIGPEQGDQTLVLVTRNAGEFAQQRLLPVRFVPLVSHARTGRGAAPG
ncbi:MAG: protein-L-isoaspartate(D-aspartate) O-methyltransferase [Alphaproteobacteria bacterium]|nr:protein-L-isoaspartate(D-aspartate) O-methyltransferase [Alphaproteobacteria bacterium]